MLKLVFVLALAIMADAAPEQDKLIAPDAPRPSTSSARVSIYLGEDDLPTVLVLQTSPDMPSIENFEIVKILVLAHEFGFYTCIVKIGTQYFLMASFLLPTMTKENKINCHGFISQQNRLTKAAYKSITGIPNRMQNWVRVGQGGLISSNGKVLSGLTDAGFPLGEVTLNVLLLQYVIVGVTYAAFMAQLTGIYVDIRQNTIGEHFVINTIGGIVFNDVDQASNKNNLKEDYWDESCEFQWGQIADWAGILMWQILPNDDPNKGKIKATTDSLRSIKNKADLTYILGNRYPFNEEAFREWHTAGDYYNFHIPQSEMQKLLAGLEAQIAEDQTRKKQLKALLTSGKSTFPKSKTEKIKSVFNTQRIINPFGKTAKEQKEIVQRILESWPTKLTPRPLDGVRT